MPLVISGKLSLPITGRPASNAEIRFRAVNSVGEIIQGAESLDRCDASGNYNISLEFARYELATKISTVDFIVHGQVTIDVDTIASDLESLIEQIGLAGGLTDELIKEFAQLKTEAVAAAGEAKQSASEAAADAKTASDAEAAITPMYNYFNANYPAFEMNYQDFATKYPDVVQKHGEVVTLEGQTQAAKDLAEKWASNPENVPVTDSEYSAFHWAEKAKQNANQTFVSGGLFTPAAGNEYPDVSGVSRDTIWIVEFSTHGETYTFTSGQLSGKVTGNGDMIFYDTPNNTWSLIPTAVSAGVISVDGDTGPSVNLESKYYWSGNAPAVSNVTGLQTELDTKATIDHVDSEIRSRTGIYKVGNISAYVGDTLQESDKLNSYQYPDDSDQWYGPVKTQSFPIIIPANPSASSGWALVNALTSDTLSLYTDIVYKSSGGNSAVEDMLSEFSTNPLSHAVGSILSTGGTVWKYLDSTGPVTIDNFRAFNVLNVIDCGAVGDSITDDYASITYAASIAKQKKLTLFFPELLFYVSQPPSLGDVKVYAERPAYSDPISALRPDGTNFINGSIGSDWSYYYNSTEEGRNTTWRTHLQSASPGAAIISDVASPVITCVDGERFNLDGIGVIGNHRLQGQHGIGHPSSLEYKGNQHSINRVRVTGCGGNGIHLPKGWEASSSEGVISSQNNGYGIYVGVIESGGSVLDSATEYLSIKNTGTANNRLGGIYFEQYRKHLNIDGFHGNNNGQYNSATENGKIDPLLGYDRNIPPREQMASLIWINDVTRDSVGQTGTCQNLHFKNIWGEQVAKGIHIRAREGTGILRNVTFDDISLIRLSQLKGVPVSDPANGCVIYLDVKYLADVDIGTIYPQSLYQLDVENVDFTENNIRALGWTPVTNKEFQFLHWKYEGTMGSFSFAADVPIVREDFTAPAINAVQTSDIIKRTHTYYPGASALAPFSKWRIYGQHQATNADYYGVYEMTVFRSNRGRWKGTANLVSVDDTGDSFTSPPTIAIDGTLSLPTRAFSMVRVEIMEGLTWIGGIDV